MRYRPFLLLTVASVSILGMATPAPSDDDPGNYNLQRTEISGVVERVDGQEAYILTDDGEEIGIQLGPQSYWNDHGWYLPEGEYVNMEVWYDPYEEYTGWYFAGEIWGPGFHFVLTNDYGVPYWVMAEEDYYYSLGYRANCVSYMVWFDCPPVYFVYLVLPVPPPVYYTCYYGPHWYGHYYDWNYGNRYCSGGSYWRDGRGYERPRDGRRFAGRRIRGRDSDGGNYYNPGNDNDRQAYSPAPTRPIRGKSPSSVRPKAQPRLDTPRSKAQPRKEMWQDRTAKSPPRNEQKFERRTALPRQEQKIQRKVTSPRNEQKMQNRVRTPMPERKQMAHKPEPRERQYANRKENPQPQQKYQARSAKPQAREQKATGRVSERKPNKSPVEKQYSKPQSKKPEHKPQSSKRSSGGSRNLDRRNIHR